MEKLGNIQEEARTNSILKTEKSREKARRLKYLEPRSKGARNNRIKTKTPDVKGREHIPPKDINSQSYLETSSTGNIGRKIRISENKHPMTETLVHRLSYIGITKWRDNLIIRGKR